MAKALLPAKTRQTATIVRRFFMKVTKVGG
jgi:hypothetical protein